MKKNALLLIILLTFAFVLTGCENNGYTVSFNTNGGNAVQDGVVEQGTTVTEPITPIKEGYTFLGWYSDSNLNVLYDFSDPLAGNLQLFAEWQINQYSITFVSNGGTSINDLTKDYGSEITEPSSFNEGYIFDGWCTDITLNDTFVFESMTAEDITLYARWIYNLFIINFESNGGSAIQSITQEGSSSFLLPVEPTKLGYTFDSWFSDESLTTKYIFDLMPTEDTTLYANWDINQYTINFESNGGSDINSMTREYESILTIPEEPIKEGYTFGGWYGDEELTTSYTFDKMPAEDISLHALWHLISYTITYNVAGGINEFNPTNFNVETTSSTFEEPIKEGYSFNGWFDNQELTGIPVNGITLGSIGDISLYAKWTINQYTITYVTLIEKSNLDTGFSLYVGETIIQTSIGSGHSMVLTSKNRIFSWGSNNYGQLGNGTTEYQMTPIEIASSFNLVNGESIIQVSSGWGHSSAVTSEGRIFTWGHNNYGQLGDGTTENKFVPVDITSLFYFNEGELIIQVSLGGEHSSALTSEGRIFTWGGNYFDQLGIGPLPDSIIPAEITSKFELADGETIIQVSLGYWHSSALTSEGRIFIWGANNYGQLGRGTTSINQGHVKEITSQFSLDNEETIVQVSLGSHHSSALTSQGRLFVWGRNDYGQLGDGATEDILIPKDIFLQLNLIEGETVIKVSLGGNHSSAFTSEGRILTWGYNYSGQLGDGTTDDRYNPVGITSNFELIDGEEITNIVIGGYSSALTSEGRIFIWGNNSNVLIPNATNFRYFKIVSTDIYDFNSNISNFIPTLDGHTFDGWYIDIEMTVKYTSNSMPAEDITLYAKWIIN